MSLKRFVVYILLLGLFLFMLDFHTAPRSTVLIAMNSGQIGLNANEGIMNQLKTYLYSNIIK